jgi:WG containing repeat
MVGFDFESKNAYPSEKLFVFCSKQYIPAESPYFYAMKMRPLGLAWAICCILVFAACGSDDPKAADEAQARPMEPLIGVDTTKPLITADEAARMARMKLMPYRENGLWGYTDSAGAVVIPARYEAAAPFNEEGLTVVKTGEGYGLLNKLGKEVVPAKLQNEIKPCGCGVFAFQQTAGFALVNSDGKRIDKGRVTEVRSHTCNQDRLPIRQGKQMAFLDTKGNAVTGFVFEEVFPFAHGVAPVKAAGQKYWSLVDLSGKPVDGGKYQELFPLVEGLGVGIQDNAVGENKYGVIDTTGRVVIPFQYARISGTFEGGYVGCAAYDPYKLASKGITPAANTWFIYNRQGVKVGETHNDIWDNFSEGLVVVEQLEKYGFADTTGKVVIPLKYDWACGFKNGLAWVGKGGKYGFIDHKGKEVIPLKYGTAYDYVFMDDHGAPVRDLETGEMFYLDKSGHENRAASTKTPKAP